MVSITIFSQQQYKMKIVSSEDNSPINDAKVITDVGVYYSNDEGFLLLESNATKAIVEAIFFSEQEVSLNQNEINNIRLNPKYIDIQDVIVNNVDIKALFQNTLKNYQTIYYNKPSLYHSIVKQKAHIGENINNLLIADMGIWSKYNAFNFAESKNTDGFIQMNLNAIRYYKSADNEYLFLGKAHITPSDFSQKLFLNAALVGILNDFKEHQITSKLINNTAGIQKIEFEGKNHPKMQFKGSIIYNKNNNAIIYLEFEGRYLAKIFKDLENALGEKYQISNDAFKISYDFTKRNHQYIPTKVKLSTEGAVIYKGKTLPVDITQEIIFQKFAPTQKQGLKHKINLSKSLIDNIATKENQDNLINLTTEEKQFLEK